MPELKLLDEPARIAALRRYEVLDTEPEAPFQKITSLVQSVLRVPIAAVSLIDEGRQWFKSQRGLSVSETPRDISFCTHTIRNRQPMIVEDAVLDPRFSANPLVTGPPFIGSYAGIPLETPDGYNIGSLCAIDTRPRIFEPLQIEILTNLAGLVIDELELRRIAEHDHLTGALSRRAFVAELDKEIARFRRYHRPSALLLLDVDHFKSVNDTHGHPAGDRVLRALVQCCGAVMRPSDVLGRLGGEEFGILLPETGMSDALVAVERFRRAIEAIQPEFDAALRITASFGVSALESSYAASDLWMTQADKGLYAAKRSGRNRWCVAGAHDRTASAWSFRARPAAAYAGGLPELAAQFGHGQSGAGYPSLQ